MAKVALTRMASAMAVTCAVYFLVPSKAALAQAPVQVELRDGSITPALMTFTEGQKISLKVLNKGTKSHNLVIPAFFVFSPNIEPGKDVSLSFTPAKVGTFPYYSDTGGKPEPGMRGTLRIHPSS